MKKGSSTVLVIFAFLAAFSALFASCEQPEKPEPYTYTYTFTVVYDANGGEGEMEPSVFSYNKPQKLRKNTFTRAGYSFKCWSRSQNTLLGTQYTDEESVTLYASPKETVQLYAVWDNTRTVKYDANGGRGNMGNSLFPPDTALRKNTFNNNDSWFRGWATSPDGPVVYQDSHPNPQLPDEKTITLYAKWSYFVYYYNGANYVGSIYTLDIPNDLRLNTFTRPGYVFAGWAASPDGPVVYTDGQSVINLAGAGETASLYAVWAVGYTVKYHANGGSGTMADSTFDIGQTQNLRANVFTLGGYAFAGWAESPDGPVIYDDERSVTDLASAGETVTLYAKWVIHPDYYVIKYDANGGGGTMADSVFLVARSAGLRSNAFSRTNYAFRGWATSPDGAAAYANGQSVTGLTGGGGMITLYAVWAGTYTVSYYANGGSGTMADSAFDIGQAQNLRQNTFIRYGYGFRGWATSPNGPVVYADGQSVTNLADTPGATVSLYAIWGNSYTIIFNSNDGNGITYKQSFTNGIPQKLQANAFSRTGYIFRGWATTWSNGPVVYADGQLVDNLSPAADGTVGLYAVWEINPETAYTVKYDANDGSGRTATSDFVINVPQALRYNSFNRAGYTFRGWAKSSNGTVEYTNGQTVSLSAAAGVTVTLYAVWKAHNYTIVFNKNANDAVGSMDAQNFTYDTAQSLRANAFARTYYTFAGWAKAANGPVEYTNEESINHVTTDGATVTLYAQWRYLTYIVVFNKNHADAAGTMENQSFTYNTPQNLRTNLFYRTGYTLIGWQESPSDRVDYTNGQSVINLAATEGATVTLYAVWSRNTYTVIFHHNDGSSNDYTSNQSFYYDLRQNLAKYSAVYFGHAFEGWATSPNGSLAFVDEQSVLNLTAEPNGKIHLYALWRIK